MARVAKISGKSLFGAEEWQQLSARSRWQGLWLVVHAWLVIGVAVAMSVIWPHPLIVFAAILVIGSRQLGLAILMHEAAHGLLASDRRWNDRVGRWLCAWPVGISLPEYRRYHLRHHTFAQQVEDPDLPLSAKFPVSRASLARKLLRDITGISFAKQRVLPLLAALFGQRKLYRSEWIFLGVQSVALALATGFGWLGWYLMLWVLPLATWYMVVLRVRNIAEHACTSRDADPWRVARTTRASWLERALVAPYFVNYHAEHHLFMSLPCYRLPTVHQALQLGGHYAEHAIPVARGYLAVLGQAAPSAEIST